MVDTRYTSESAFVTNGGYYVFSGWDKSNFNITEDTTIHGSWSEKKTNLVPNFQFYNLTSRYWHAVCYGNGKFVAITTTNNVFAYSTDGFTWIEFNLDTNNRKWMTICYGNDKFIGFAENNNVCLYGNFTPPSQYIIIN